MRILRHSIPLSVPRIVSAPHSTQSYSEYTLLSVAEQSALRRKLARSAETDEATSLGDIDREALPNTLDSLLLLDAIASVTREAIKTTKLRSDESRLELLTKPLLVFEFRREKDDYASFVHTPKRETPDGKYDTGWIVKSLLSHFQLTGAKNGLDKIQARRISDEAASRRFRGLTASTPNVFFGNIHADKSHTGPRPELWLLCGTLVDHISSYYLSGSEGGLSISTGTGIPLNSFTRAVVRNWCDELEAFSIVQPDSLGSSDAPNCYPFVAVEPIDEEPGLLMVCAVTALDQWFVDDRVPQDRRLPGITLAIYDTQQSPFRSLADRRSLQDAVAGRIASISARMTAFRRGQALTNAAGESSQASRYWFGEGVARLLETDSDAGGLETEDVVDFWSRFVEDLLCGVVPGVKATETMPFDRAVIIRGAPSNASRLQDHVEIRVLETALQSTAADTRFQFLTSLERDPDDVADLNLTNKIIKFRSDLVVRGNGKINTATIAAAESRFSSAARHLNLQGDESSEHSDLDKEQSFCDQILKTLLQQPIAFNGDNEARSSAEILEREARKLFDADGFFYEYKNGIDLQREAPLLHHLNDEYQGILLSRNSTTLSKAKVERIRKQKAEKNRDSKVISISYDPTLIQNNRRSSAAAADQEDETSFFVPPSEAFTLILIADLAPERGVQDISAERDDLKLLVTLILRQRMRDRRREASLLTRRVQVIDAMLQSLLHRIGNSGLAKEEKEAIRINGEEIKKAIQFNQASLSAVEPQDTAEDYLRILWTKGQEQKNLAGGLRGAIQSYVDEHLKSQGSTVAVRVELMLSPVARLSLKLPMAAVRECLDVVLKNAAEAAASLRKDTPTTRFINVGVVTFALTGKQAWALEVIVENSTAPLTAVTWRALSATEPQAQSGSTSKAKSTGIGVFAARNLLRNGLGSQADIRYEITGTTRLQARICLPGRIDRTASASDEDSESTVIGEGLTANILYVEDEEDYRGSATAFIAERCPGKRPIVATTLRHARNALKEGAPLLLITDLQFPREPNDDRPDPRAGFDLIKDVVPQTESGRRRPPIWVISGSERGEVIKTLRKESITPLHADGYRAVPNAPTIEDLVADGTISVLENKHLGENDNVSEALRRLDQIQSESEPSDTHQLTSSSRTHNGARRDVIVEPASLGLPLGAHFESLRKHCINGSNAVIVVSRPPGMTFKAAISTWVSTGQFLDPDSTDDIPQVFHPWYSFGHKRIVANLGNGDTEQLTPSAKHWLLRNNAVLTTMPSKTIGPQWIVIPKELNGPVSRIRHDIKGLLQKPTGLPSEVLEQLLILTKEASALLQLPDRIENDLDAFLTDPNEERLEIAVGGLLSAPAETRPNEVADALTALFNGLEELRRHTPAPDRQLESRIADMTMAVEVTRLFICG